MIIISFLLLFGCGESGNDLDAGLEYYPEVGLLEDGLVWKYYYHKNKKGRQRKTDILYRKIVLNGNNLLLKEYRADFAKSNEYQIKIEGDNWIREYEEVLDYGKSNDELFDTYRYTILQSTDTDWVGDNAILDRQYLLDGNGARKITTQTGHTDTLVDGRRVKIINWDEEFISIQDDIEGESIRMSRRINYEEGLGMTHSIMESDELVFELALDELITVAEFNRRADHGTHRVGYIDTLQTLDDHSLFKPCFHENKINDYYNDERAEFKGGKGRLRAILKDKLNPEKLHDESGYLTYRFVVNCNGEAGWFVTEEAGLDYERRQFSEACRKHLFEILEAENSWKNLTYNGEAIDAYTYITFKIENGEIIEILP